MGEVERERRRRELVKSVPVVELVVASVHLPRAAAKNIFCIFSSLDLFLRQCYELCPPPTHLGLCCTNLFCRCSKGARTRISECLPAACLRVQSKKTTTTTRSSWLPDALYERAQASARSSGGSGEDFAQPVHIPSCPVPGAEDKGPSVDQGPKPG